MRGADVAADGAPALGAVAGGLAAGAIGCGAVGRGWPATFADGRGLLPSPSLNAWPHLGHVTCEPAGSPGDLICPWQCGQEIRLGDVGVDMRAAWRDTGCHGSFYPPPPTRSQCYYLSMPRANIATNRRMMPMITKPTTCQACAVA